MNKTAIILGNIYPVLFAETVRNPETTGNQSGDPVGSNDMETWLTKQTSPCCCRSKHKCFSFTTNK